MKGVRLTREGITPRRVGALALVALAPVLVLGTLGVAERGGEVGSFGGTGPGIAVVDYHSSGDHLEAQVRLALSAGDGEISIRDGHGDLVYTSPKVDSLHPLHETVALQGTAGRWSASVRWTHASGTYEIVWSE